MWMTMALLCSAAFLGGALNTIAGGGSFLTLPALAFVGVPLVMANATGAVALLPGYLTGAWALRGGVSAERPLLPMGELVVLAAAGGATGAALLATTNDAMLGRIIPWLMLLATVLFLVGPAWMARRTGFGTAPAHAGTPSRTRVVLLAVSIYGGYFNGGMGILMLALFVLLGQTDLHAMNRSKNLASAVLTLIAVAVYAMNDAIDWRYAPAMMLAGALGGWAGGWLARVVPVRYVRGFIVVTGAVMTAIFFWRSR